DNADLTQADLSAAYLIKADLRKATLVDADLTQAVLSEANLADANLEGAELMDSYLHGANLKGVVNLTCDQIELANFDKDTVFPDYITIQWTEDGYFECCEK
ncbi:MAG: pentapeptide repeat-containing protein, partial [Nitrospina sp.]|nr:pentapeptide repeat-containing protein [Nitrospina sp.]